MYTRYTSTSTEVVVVTRVPTVAPVEVLTPLERQLRDLNASLYDKGNLENEQRLRRMLVTQMRHSIGPRFPLNDIPLMLVHT